MRIRHVSAAPLGEPVEQLAEDLMAVADEAERLARMPAFVRDQVAPWKEVNKETRKAIQSKAKSVARAQGWLLAAIATLASVTVLVLGGWA
jgi:predicted anti-sigma-YlaC factor YlaD